MQKYFAIYTRKACKTVVRLWGGNYSATFHRGHRAPPGQSDISPTFAAFPGDLLASGGSARRLWHHAMSCVHQLVTSLCTCSRHQVCWSDLHPTLGGNMSQSANRARSLDTRRKVANSLAWQPEADLFCVLVCLLAALPGHFLQGSHLFWSLLG